MWHVQCSHRLRDAIDDHRARAAMRCSELQHDSHLESRLKQVKQPAFSAQSQCYRTRARGPSLELAISKAQVYCISMLK